MRLQDKICAITGAGSGIGEAAARRFAEEGASVAIIEINEDNGRRIADDIGNGSLFVATDVSDPKSVEAAFNSIRKHFGRLDVLYNNASVFLGDHDKPVADLDLDIYHKVISINQHSVVYCCKFAIPLMIESGGGSIINTSSSAGVIGIPGCDSYTASKGATTTLTRSMAVEYGPYGIRVNCIAPAAIYTPMIRESKLNHPNFDEQQFLNTTPVRRWGTPEDIANTALFLASDEGGYINGAILVADGGITIT